MAIEKYVESEEFVADIVWAFYQYSNYKQIYSSPFFKYILHGDRAYRAEKYFDAITEPREKKIAQAIKTEREKNHGEASHKMHKLLSIVLVPYLSKPYQFGAYYDMKKLWSNDKDEIINKDWFVCWAIELLNTKRSFNDLKSVVEIYNCICDIIVSKSSFIGEVKFALERIPEKQQSLWNGFKYDVKHDETNPGIVFESINQRLKRVADDLCLNQSEYSKDELDKAATSYKQDAREMFTILFDKIGVPDNEKERILDWNFNKYANYVDYMLAGKTVEERERWAEQKIAETSKNIENLYKVFDNVAEELAEHQSELYELNKRMVRASENLEQIRDYEGWVLFGGSKSVFDEIKRLDVNADMLVFQRELNSLRVRETTEKRPVDSKLLTLTEKQEEFSILLRRFKDLYERMQIFFGALRENIAGATKRIQEIEDALAKRPSSTPLRPVLNKVLKETRAEKEDMMTIVDDGKVLQDNLNNAMQFLEKKRNDLIEREIADKKTQLPQGKQQEAR